MLGLVEVLQVPSNEIQYLRQLRRERRVKEGEKGGILTAEYQSCNLCMSHYFGMIDVCYMSDVMGCGSL